MSDPVRILRLIARLNVGGPSLHVCYLTSELEHLGYETVLAAGRVGSGEGSMEYVARERQIEPLFIEELHRDIDPLDDVWAVRHVLKLIREFKPDILHTHTAKAGAVGRIAALRSGSDRPKAVVHTFHGHVLRGYFNPAVTATFRQVERRLARSTDALIAVSPEVRDDLVSFGIAPADRIEVVRLGLDLDARTAVPPNARAEIRTSLDIPENSFLVGWLGRMTEVKRVDDLLRSFARLRASGVDAHIALVGDGPLRDEMEALAGSLGVRDRCHFVGYRQDVGAFFAAFDTVALTSANEGTPVTLIEALAARVPVVSTDVGGVSDVVGEGETGFLVPAGDLDAIADRLARLAHDRELRERFGEAGSVSVRERYSVPRLVQDMDALYRRLLERPSAPRRGAPLTPAIPQSLPPEARSRIVPAANTLRILIVSQYFPPEIGATQSRMQMFAEYLAARGHQVTVIAEFPNHPQGVMPDRYRGRVFEVDTSNPYRVIRVWVKTSRLKSQTTRLAFYSSFTVLATAVGPLAGRADVVLATSPPLFTGLVGTALARMNGAPFVLDVRDLWPAAAGALNQISGDWMYRGAAGLERLLYRQANAVVAVTKPFCDHIDTFRGARPRSVMIPNGTIELFFDVGQDLGARSSLGVPDDAFLVTFAGTHGIAQALPAVLDAAGAVNGRIHFAFVGEGPVKEQLQQRASQAGLANVHFHPQVPITEIPAILAASDALLVPLSAHPVFADFVPSKMIDFMATGKPVVLSARGEAARLLDQAAGGLVVPPEDPQALATSVEWLMNNPAEARALAERGREFARGRLRAVQAERLEQVLLDVTQHHTVRTRARSA
jgi:glycosyltransferase involved in cell wall biosynthesis